MKCLDLKIQGHFMRLQAMGAEGMQEGHASDKLEISAFRMGQLSEEASLRLDSKFQAMGQLMGCHHGEILHEMGEDGIGGKLERCHSLQSAEMHEIRHPLLRVEYFVD